MKNFSTILAVIWLNESEMSRYYRDGPMDKNYNCYAPVGTSTFIHRTTWLIISANLIERNVTLMIKDSNVVSCRHSVALTCHNDDASVEIKNAICLVTYWPVVVLGSILSCFHYNRIGDKFLCVRFKFNVTTEVFRGRTRRADLKTQDNNSNNNIILSRWQWKLLVPSTTRDSTFCPILDAV